MILHIDDNPDALDLVSAILDVNKYEHVSAKTIEEVLNDIKSRKFSLIILDLKLKSEMQGEDLIKLLKKSRNKTKVIVLTASPIDLDKELKSKYKGLVIECITKPFEPDTLIKAVKKVI